MTVKRLGSFITHRGEASSLSIFLIVVITIFKQVYARTTHNTFRKTIPLVNYPGIKELSSFMGPETSLLELNTVSSCYNIFVFGGKLEELGLLNIFIAMYKLVGVQHVSPDSSCFQCSKT